MSRIAFLTLVLARSHDVPPSRRRAAWSRPCISARDPGARPARRACRRRRSAARETPACCRRPDLFEADEHADAVIDVDDEVADLQIAQVREKSLGRGAAPFGRATLFLEDIGLGVDLQARIRQAEAARQDRRRRRGPLRTARLRRARPESRRRRTPSATRWSVRRGPAWPPRTASPRRASCGRLISATQSAKAAAHFDASADSGCRGSCASHPRSDRRPTARRGRDATAQWPNRDARRLVQSAISSLGGVTSPRLRSACPGLTTGAVTSISARHAPTSFRVVCGAQLIPLFSGTTRVLCAVTFAFANGCR